MPIRRVPTSTTPPSRGSGGESARQPPSSAPAPQARQARGARAPRQDPRGLVDVALQLAIGREGIGLELARAARLGCLTIAELTVTLPGLRFPVDVSGGVPKFRHRRGELQRLHVEVPLRPLERWVAPSLRGLVGTRTPEVSVGTRGQAATICVAIHGRPEEDLPAAVLAFELHVLAEGADLAFVVHGARGHGLPAPATALAIASVEAAFARVAEPEGACFVVRRAAEQVARALLPEVGARVPATPDVAWMSVAPHGDTWLFHAMRGALEGSATQAALRAREIARLLRNADEVLLAGDLEQARDRYVDVLERAPRHPEVVRRIVDIDARTGGRAEAALAALAEVNDKDVLLGTLPGRLLAETGDVLGALANLEHAGEADPAAALSASAFETAARLAQDTEHSAGWLDRALARAPRSTSARWLRVAKRLALGRLDDALADVEYLEALARGTRARHAVWSRAGRQWDAAGMASRAGAIYERALRYVPDEPEALAGLGKALLADGRVARGVALLTRAVELAESRGAQSSALVVDLACALADHVDDLPAAIARAGAIPSAAPEAPFARGLEGRWRLRLGDFAGAALAFARLRELASSLSGSADARLPSLAALLVEGAEMELGRTRPMGQVGDAQAAQRHLSVALQLCPKDPKIRRLYREVGALLARRWGPEPEGTLQESTASRDPEQRPEDLPLPGGLANALLSDPLEVSDDDGTRAARVEELTRRLQSNPQDDTVVEELTALLDALGRRHELLALLSARLEDATPERRALLMPRTRAVLQRMADEAEASGRADEAGLYRGALARLS